MVSPGREPRILRYIIDGHPREPRILRYIIDGHPREPRILRYIIDGHPRQPRILRYIIDGHPREPRILRFGARHGVLSSICSVIGRRCAELKCLRRFSGPAFVMTQ